MVQSKFIRRKIKFINEDLVNLKKLPLNSFRAFSEDVFTCALAERFLEKIVTRAIDINSHLVAQLGDGTEKIRDYHHSFLTLGDLGILPRTLSKKIAPSAGLRNALAHEYDNIDPKKVYSSAKKALEQYPKYCKYILKYLKKHPE